MAGLAGGAQIPGRGSPSIIALELEREVLRDSPHTRTLRLGLCARVVVGVGIDIVGVGHTSLVDDELDSGDVYVVGLEETLIARNERVAELLQYPKPLCNRRRTIGVGLSSFDSSPSTESYTRNVCSLMCSYPLFQQFRYQFRQLRMGNCKRRGRPAGTA